MNEQPEAPAVTNQSSPTLGALAAALAKAQGEMTSAKKSNTLVTPQFKSKYADLAGIWEACRAALSKNGLSVIQRVSDSPAGVCVRTRLMHSSGEWIEDSLVVPLDRRTAQGMGSAITYARKYALQAMVGVAADEDDDGAEASAPADNQKQQQPAVTGSRTVQGREKAAAKVATLREGEEPPPEEQRSSEPDAWALISDLLKKHKLYGQAAVSRIKGATSGKTDRTQLNMEDYEKIKASLEAAP